MAKPCPLCASTNTDEIDFVSRKRLNDAYIAEYGIDIMEDVQTDMPLAKCNDCDLRYFYPAYPGGQSFYDKLQQFEWYYKEEKYEYHYVSKMFKGTGSVLEIGCGTGEFSSHIPMQSYRGLEFSEVAVQKGIAKGRNISSETIEVHAQQNREKYDVVCSFQVLEHVVNPQSFIAACLACLKPHGVLILTTPSEDSWLQYKQDFCLNLPPHHITRWTDRCFNNVAKQFNLRLEDIHHEPLDDFHHPWYLNAFFVYMINKKLGIKHSVLRQPKHWLSHKISDWIVKTIGKDIPNAFQGYGHTAVAVFKK